MKAPFPFFGGKSRVAHEVWARFGNVVNYVEPFFGSGAVLLARPHPPGVETVNDKDCYISNFWRALQHDPEGVAEWADAPVNEADLRARHLWLLNRHDFRERMLTDPDYNDVKIAGWWVWGISAWIGSGWCSEASIRKDGKATKHLPHLGGAGMGVHRKLPYLHTGSRGVLRSQLYQNSNGLYDYFQALAQRLRHVRVCCGDWTRVLGPTPTYLQGPTGVFLDPPYPEEANRSDDLYASEDLQVAHAVREWALANGDNPLLRVAICGYEGVWEMPDTWECLAWKPGGGYAGQGNNQARENRHRERIWFSPYCLKAEQLRLGL